MIVTELAHAREQIRQTPAMQRALDFLHNVQGQDLADGRIEIDGSRVYALVQSYRTVPRGDPLPFEAHHKYIDVQYVMAGQEVIGWAHSGWLTVTSAYDEAKEAWLGTLATGQPTFVWMAAGDLVVMYPEDGHAPRLAAGEPSAVKKIVVKVALEGQPAGQRASILDTFSLRGKVALVIGGARTLGYDMADALADAGADLVITSRNLAHAEAATERLRAARGVAVLPLALDVRQHSEVAAVAAQARAWKGHIDVLINNAGGGIPGRPTDILQRSPEDVEALIATNLTGALYCCQEVGRIMAEQRSGKIINIASIAGLVGRDRRMYQRSGLAQQPVDYAAAKAGVIGLTLDMAAYLAPFGVYVNCISPGGFERGQPEAFVRAYSERTALGRMGRDGIDIKAAALFLASSASDYVTGHNLVLDGGFILWH